MTASTAARSAARWLWGLALIGGLLLCGSARGDGVKQWLGLVDLDALNAAIVEMDVSRARELSEAYQQAKLSPADRERLQVERARLALYMSDCDGAEAIASGLDSENPEVRSLYSVAAGCSAAVAGAHIVQDEGRGVWIRLQDRADLPLVPFLVEVADRARAAVLRDLSVRLPEPLRIDLVRDLFSLAAVSGLPLEAAETTGTVAVARWGRVTMLSPRAASHGYPWEDTLAHELVHLGLSRATRDFAPLWLQEGVAKRQEVRWRPKRPIDEGVDHDGVARNALLTDTSVGVDKLGQSIAMLDTAGAAAIAFAEVASFMNFWIAQNGRGAFRLFLADLRGLRDRDPGTALRSVSGYTLSEWIQRWQEYLRSLPDEAAPSEQDEASDFRLARRNERLGHLLLSGQYFAAAAGRFGAAVSAAPNLLSSRVGATVARLAMGQAPVAREVLGASAPAGSRDASWYALRGRLSPGAGDQGAWVNDFRLALSLDPVSELPACRGELAVEPDGATPHGRSPSHQPIDVSPADAEKWRALCQGARARPAIQ